MNNITYINNKFVKHSKAKISVEDRGFLFADSIYELIGIFNKEIIDTDQHLNRLDSSLKKVKIKYRFPIKILWSILLSTTHQQNSELVLRSDAR